jgi:hypothetical protein
MAAVYETPGPTVSTFGWSSIALSGDLLLGRRKDKP